MPVLSIQQKKKKIFDLVASDFFHLVIEFFGEKYLNIKNP